MGGQLTMRPPSLENEYLFQVRWFQIIEGLNWQEKMLGNNDMKKVVFWED